MRISHNRETVAKILYEVCHAVKIKPHLLVPEYETFPSNATANNDDARVKGMVTGSRFFLAETTRKALPEKQIRCIKVSLLIKKRRIEVHSYIGPNYTSLFRSYFLCLQGCRATQRNEPTAKSFSAIVHEGRLSGSFLRLNVEIRHRSEVSSFLFRPLLRGKELYTQMVFLLSKFWPIDIFIVES